MPLPLGLRSSLLSMTIALLRYRPLPTAGYRRGAMKEKLNLNSFLTVVQTIAIVVIAIAEVISLM